MKKNCREIKVYDSFIKDIKAIGRSVVIVLVAICMLLFPKQIAEVLLEESYNPEGLFYKIYKIIAWIGLCLFSFDILLSLYKIVTKKPQLILNELGMWQAKSIFKVYNKEEIIKWNNIETINPEKDKQIIYIKTATQSFQLELKDTTSNVDELLEFIDRERKNLNE